MCRQNEQSSKNFGNFTKLYLPNINKEHAEVNKRNETNAAFLEKKAAKNEKVKSLIDQALRPTKWRETSPGSWMVVASHLRRGHASLNKYGAIAYAISTTYYLRYHFFGRLAEELPVLMNTKIFLIFLKDPPTISHICRDIGDWYQTITDEQFIHCRKRDISSTD
ncbi:hypothetical protein DICVIV_08433 [Dictyocaulus viviparus]|uniref:Uncharacterized protein n=1 Tax=Dictyocaulus viviparus TaxID=29172 RepID=A0A0D8XT08_DICVI|nr:hypothetical protein DICVIV_08433 [Dictyocaulus viviparus]